MTPTVSSDKATQHNRISHSPTLRKSAADERRAIDADAAKEDDAPALRKLFVAGIAIGALVALTPAEHNGRETAPHARTRN